MRLSFQPPCLCGLTCGKEKRKQPEGLRKVLRRDLEVKKDQRDKERAACADEALQNQGKSRKEMREGD